MKKLLITGGDSYTSGDYGIYQQLGIDTWPKRLAEKNDWDFLNTAKAGCSNRHILNSVIDAVVNNPDREKIVIVSWSEIYRLSFIDDTDLDHSIFLISDSEHKRRSELSESLAAFFGRINNVRKDTIELMKWNHNQNIKHENPGTWFNERVVIQSFKLMWILKDFCASKDIPCYFVNTFDPFASDSKVAEEMFGSCDKSNLFKTLANNTYVNQIENDVDYMGLDYNIYNDIDKNNMFIEFYGEINLHPNNEGHEYIADTINNFIKTGIRPEPNRNSDEKLYEFFR